MSILKEKNSIYKKFDQQTQKDLKDSNDIFNRKIAKKNKKTIPFYQTNEKFFSCFYDPEFFDQILDKKQFLDICIHSGKLLDEINQQDKKINIEFKTKKIIKFALFLLLISTVMLFACLQMEGDMQKYSFFIALIIGFTSVVISFISSMFAFFNIPSIEKFTNPMYGVIKEYYNSLNEQFKEKGVEFVFHMQIKMLDINKNI